MSGGRRGRTPSREGSHCFRNRPGRRSSSPSRDTHRAAESRGLEPHTRRCPSLSRRGRGPPRVTLCGGSEWTRTTYPWVRTAFQAGPMPHRSHFQKSVRASGIEPPTSPTPRVRATTAPRSETPPDAGGTDRQDEPLTARQADPGRPRRAARASPRASARWRSASPHPVASSTASPPSLAVVQ